MRAKPPAEEPHTRARAAVAHYAPAEPQALGVTAALAAAAILWVLVPVGIGVLVGALLAFTLYRPFRPLARRTRRPTLVALGLTVSATLAVAGTMAALGYLLVLQGVRILLRLPQALSTGGNAALLVRRLARPFAVFIPPDELIARLRGAVGTIATSLAGLAAQALGIVVDDVLALFFMAITMDYVLLHWAELGRRAEHLLPMNPHHTRRLMREIRRLGRMVVVGNFGTALVQGAIAGIGDWIGHVPEPAFLGAITAVASLVPVFGTMLVWVPAALVLAVEGHTGAAVFEVLWGSIMVVGLCDYFVRPRLVGRGERMSTWLTFVGLFGGIKLFGFVGFLFGPLLVGVGAAALRLCERARRFRLNLG